ncbi:hypothetical protein EDD11_010411, partial [Mortierella claussenii]
SDHVKVIVSAQEVVIAQVPATTSRRRAQLQDVIQSSLPKDIVDAVRAKFMQAPQAAQFEIRRVVDAPKDSLRAAPHSPRLLTA